MASLQQFPSGNFHITFHFGGKRYKRSLKTNDRRKALAMKARAEETALLVEQGRIELPESVDVPTFLLSDGKLATKTTCNEAKLSKLFEGYFGSLPEGNLEPGTIAMMQTHRGHLERHFGKYRVMKLLTFNDLQGYINKRAKDDGIRGRKLHASTIKKEINTLRAVWNWASVANEIPQVEYPSKGLRYRPIQKLIPGETVAIVTVCCHLAHAFSSDIA